MALVLVKFAHAFFGRLTVLIFWRRQRHKLRPQRELEPTLQLTLPALYAKLPVERTR